jgi:phage shock protein A
MANNAGDNTSSAGSTDQIKKQRKKQAKREAKAMLAVEQAKAAVQSAEKKLARAQARLEARTAHLHTLEADLAELRTSHEELEVSAPETGFDQQTGQPEPEYETAGSNQAEQVSGVSSETQSPESELYQETGDNIEFSQEFSQD